MRYRYLVLFTAASLGVLFVYYLIWRRGHPQQPEPTTTSQPSPPTQTPPPEPTRRHQPQSGGPPTSSSPTQSAEPVGQESDYGVLLHRTLTAPIAGLRAQDIQDTY
ncbi:MAG: hypothetical protein M3Y27_05310, partial [Acidobacteriota bacterium]|nr:hypothetical protein [Acidobacteriota bacterium]